MKGACYIQGSIIIHNEEYRKKQMPRTVVMFRLFARRNRGFKQLSLKGGNSPGKRHWVNDWALMAETEGILRH